MPPPSAPLSARHWPQDMFFDLRSKTLALECAPSQKYHGHDCTNPEVKPDPGDPLVVTKLQLTIAAPWGP